MAMSEVKQFRLPDVGEGLTEAEIVSWKVKPGDTVKVNDIVVEIETAKSLVELPSPYAGTVSELLVEEGTTIAVHTPIISVDVSGGAAVASAAEVDTADPPAGETVPAPADSAVTDMVPEVAAPAADEAVEPGLIGGPAPGGRTSVLVGYGPRSTEAKRRPRKSAAAPAAAAQPAAGPAKPSAPVAGVTVLAKPPVRKLARDLGVDLTTVTASGLGGTITREDVQAAVSGTPAPPDALTDGAAAAVDTAASVTARLGGETRVPVKGVRKMTAQAMVSSAFSAPHVTEWMTVDVSATMELVERLRAHRDFRDLRVSPLLVVMKALCLAVRRTPEVNATWDEAAGEIVLKHYVNLGIAAATPRGLVVPNVKGADAMSLPELARALADLVETARAGRTQPADMSGGTITITNVGIFGVDSGTPIINPGESAILCFGAIRQQPWVVDGAVVPRWGTTLALSFDHRLVDGAQGSRFLADVAAILEDPATALLWA